MDVYLLLQILYDVTLIACCSYAIARGGRDERIAAAVMLAGSALTVVAALLPGFSWRTDRLGVTLIDLAVLGALFTLALRTDRFWPLWMTAFHLIAVATHLAILVDRERTLRAYVLLQGFWAYPMLAALMIGTRRRARSSGSDALSR